MHCTALRLTLILGHLHLCLGLTPAIPKFPCPPEWSFYESKVVCLRKIISANLKQRQSALTLCQKAADQFSDIRIDLATISDKEMQDFINLHVVNRKTDRLWIGGWNLEETINRFEEAEPSDPEKCIYIPPGFQNEAVCQKMATGVLCQLKVEGATDLCLNSNGGCSHICNTVGFQKKTCSCPVEAFPIGYMLDKAGTTCLEVTVDHCHPDNGGCEHTCLSTESGPECSCLLGYKLRRGTFCDDIDECLDGSNGGCHHNCTNTIGGVNCSCETGFLKISDSVCEAAEGSKASEGVGGIDKGKTVKLALMAIGLILALALLGKVAKVFMLRYCLGEETRAQRKQKARKAASENKVADHEL